MQVFFSYFLVKEAYEPSWFNPLAGGFATLIYVPVLRQYGDWTLDFRGFTFLHPR